MMDRDLRVKMHGKDPAFHRDGCMESSQAIGQSRIYCYFKGPIFQGLGQIRRAAVSIASNIAEGFQRGGTSEFIQFLSIAKGFTGEVMTQLFIASDPGYLPMEEFEYLKGIAEETGRMIGGFMKYLKRSEIKGAKYR